MSRPKKPETIATPYVAPPPRARFTPAYYTRFHGSVRHLSNRVPNWIQQIAAGELRIPRFQREYVWTDDQIVALLDSLFRGDYVGSVLLWERYGLPASSERFGEIAIECPAGQGLYVVDGQQRLSAIATAFMSGRFFFDVQEGAFTHAAGPWQLPLRLAFAGYDWTEWIDGHAAEHALDRNRLFDCTSKACGMFIDMEMSGLMLTHQWTRDRVVETFQRINTMGTPISADELRAALARAEENQS